MACGFCKLGMNSLTLSEGVQFETVKKYLVHKDILSSGSALYSEESSG